MSAEAVSGRTVKVSHPLGCRMHFAKVAKDNANAKEKKFFLPYVYNVLARIEKLYHNEAGKRCEQWSEGTTDSGEKGIETATAGI